MDKVWYITFDNNRENPEHKEGPYAIFDVKTHPKVTPDTLVWKEGFTQWVPLREITELHSIFEDQQTDSIDTPIIQGLPKKPLLGEDEIVTLPYEPPTFYFWIFIALLIALYTFYRLFYAV